MGIMARPRAPEGPDQAGKAFWQQIIRTYELSPAELVGLHGA